MKKALVAVVIILAELSTFAYAEQPVDVLQKLIDQGTNILKGPIYKNTGGAEPGVIVERLQIKPADLEREVAALRHMEKIRGELRQGKNF